GLAARAGPRWPRGRAQFCGRGSVAPLLLPLQLALGKSTLQRSSRQLGRTDGAGTPPRLNFTSSSLLRARLGERGLDDLSKALDREGADHGPPVDQKARRGPEPEPAGLFHIHVDGAGELAAVQAPGERDRVDPEVGRVPDQFRALERGLRRVEAVVVRKVPPRGPGAAGRLVRAAGQLVPR